MTQAQHIVSKFGGVSALAGALGHRNPTTVSGWVQRGFIPARQQRRVLDAAHGCGVDLQPDDFFNFPTGEAA
ncbi:carph-isopro domain-containing protein [Roseospira marina]|uniref:carph-isopro domain-containing protein n=1 Tax=Roseospira marina TaxID=140057 RepID=UPI001478911F|nr:hypothetical protein [Roseospira marina]MBB4316255.1 hypothetical protein [Roseospira marina]MBB5089437.1 hypothetical protein [Roseospira marina]